MLASLSSLANDLSEINKKEPTNEFIDNFRIMLAILSSHVNNCQILIKKNQILIEKNQQMNLLITLEL